jgi:chaperone required for assembly of F1-ATPase
LIAGAHLTGLCREVVVSAKFDQTRIEKNVGAAPFQHGGLEIVVENGAGLAVPCLKSMHVAAQEVLRRLIEEELQIQSAGIRQRDDEAG